jgi:transposase-like protein
MLTYRYRAYQAGIKEQVVEMAINGSGIRGTARVLKIDKNTIISTLKKAITLVQVNPKLSELSADGGLFGKFNILIVSFSIHKTTTNA